MEKIFVSLKAGLDLRHAQLLGHADNVKKMAIKEKEEAEYAAAEFAGFGSFTEGLLIQGTPLEIAGSHKQASGSLHSLFFFLSFFFFFQLSHSSLFQVQARNETLKRLESPAEPSVKQPPSFDSTNLDDLKEAISSFGSIRH